MGHCRGGFRASAPLHHDLFSVVFTIDTSGFEFSAQTTTSIRAKAACAAAIATSAAASPVTSSGKARFVWPCASTRSRSASGLQPETEPAGVGNRGKGQDHRNRSHNVRANCDFATPPLATPGEGLGESVDLIVMAAGKSEQLSDEFFEPTGALRKSN